MLHQWKHVNFVVSIILIDGLAPSCPKTSVGTVMAKFSFHIEGMGT